MGVSPKNSAKLLIGDYLLNKLIETYRSEFPIEELMHASGLNNREKLLDIVRQNYRNFFHIDPNNKKTIIPNFKDFEGNRRKFTENFAEAVSAVKLGHPSEAENAITESGLHSASFADRRRV